MGVYRSLLKHGKKLAVEKPEPPNPNGKLVKNYEVEESQVVIELRMFNFWALERVK